MEIDKDLPFETLLKLEQQVGSKNFREAHGAGGSNSRKRKTNLLQRGARESDEEPEEYSSKHPPKRAAAAREPRVRHVPAIDPRFNPRAGTFKEKHFKKNFQFAFDLKEKELEDLKKSVKNSDNPEEIQKAKYLIQRMENQKRAQQKKSQQLQPTKTMNGTKYFPSKKEILAKELVDKFVELKDAGKLTGHLEKRRKKQAGKERKRMNIEKE